MEGLAQAHGASKKKAAATECPTAAVGGALNHRRGKWQEDRDEAKRAHVLQHPWQDQSWGQLNTHNNTVMKEKFKSGHFVRNGGWPPAVWACVFLRSWWQDLRSVGRGQAGPSAAAPPSPPQPALRSEQAEPPPPPPAGSGGLHAFAPAPPPPPTLDEQGLVVTLSHRDAKQNDGWQAAGLCDVTTVPAAATTDVQGATFDVRDAVPPISMLRQVCPSGGEALYCSVQLYTAGLVHLGAGTTPAASACHVFRAVERERERDP